MNIIIDGYNVIGTIHKSLQKAREVFIAELSQYKKITQHNITVVFDGSTEFYSHSRELRLSGIRVIYSDGLRKADDVIKEIIIREKKLWVVITSDTDIAKHAWAVNAVPIKSEWFIKRVYIRIRNREVKIPYLIDKDSHDDKDEHIHHRGNPQRLSKKERLQKAVIAKL